MGKVQEKALEQSELAEQTVQDQEAPKSPKKDDSTSGEQEEEVNKFGGSEKSQPTLFNRSKPLDQKKTLLSILQEEHDKYADDEEITRKREKYLPKKEVTYKARNMFSGLGDSSDSSEYSDESESDEED